MITAQKKIESALEGREMNSNAIQLKPINKGKIAIERNCEKDKSIAMQQLNGLTEYLTEKLAQKYPLK